MIALLGLIPFLIYTIGVMVKWGVQPSISKSYYCHEDKLLWWAFIIAFSLPVMIEAANQNATLMWIAGGCSWFVGASPDFLRMLAGGKSNEYTVHMIAAYALVLFAILGIGIDLGMWTFAVIIFAVIAGLKLFKIPNDIWWIEVVAMFAAVGALTYGAL